MALPLHILTVVSLPKLGVGKTVTKIEVGIAHCGNEAVKEYEADMVLLITAGDHVPLIPFNDIAGKDGNEVPLQIVSVILKRGVSFWLILKFAQLAIPLLPHKSVRLAGAGLKQT